MLRWLISTVGLAALQGEVSAAVRRAVRRALLGALAVLLWLVALGFAVATFIIWLSGELGPIAACGIVAAALAIGGLVVQFVLAMSASRRRRERPPSPLSDLAAGFDGKPGAGVGTLGSMVIVAVAGYLLGRGIFRR